MKTVTTVEEVRNQVKEWRAEGLTVGLVPTMGFLHEGHKSLIVRAAKGKRPRRCQRLCKPDPVWCR